MEFLLLLGILALLMFGPRQGGRRPGPVVRSLGVVVLAWLAVAFLVSWIWRETIGPIPW